MALRQVPYQTLLSSLSKSISKKGGICRPAATGGSMTKADKNAVLGAAARTLAWELYTAAEYGRTGSIRRSHGEEAGRPSCSPQHHHGHAASQPAARHPTRLSQTDHAGLSLPKMLSVANAFK